MMDTPIYLSYLKEILYMMKSTPIYLSSLNCNKGPSHDFTTSFNPVMRLDPNRDYFVALDEIAMSYSWYNVSKSYENNTLKYSHDSGTRGTPLNSQMGISHTMN